MTRKRKVVAGGSSSRKRNGGGDGDGDDMRWITPRDLELDPDSTTDDDDDDVFNNAKIKVNTPTGNTISLKVKGSDTIGSVKVKIQEHELIPFDQQELIFNQTALEDMDTLANLRIKKGCTLTLMHKDNTLANLRTNNLKVKSLGFITIYIKTLGLDTTDSLKVKGSDTVGDIKSRNLYRYMGLLIFNDIVLEDSGTLDDFNVINGSTITHVDKEARKMKVFVKTYTGKTITVFVDPTDTISEVKFIIADEEDIPRDEQVLIYNNMVLGDGGTLYDFNITRKSTLTLMHRPREFEGFMQIFIKTLTGEIITLDVKGSDTLGDVKAMIQDKLDVPCDEQELIFNEMVIHDIHTLGDFHINNGSTLTLMRISRGFMPIFVECYTGETVTLDVRPSDTIRDVKSKLCGKKHVSPSKHLLIFNGKQLEDSATLAHYHITKESTVYLDFKPI